MDWVIDILVRLKVLKKKHLDAEIQQKDQNICEPSVQLTLAQAVPKGSRFDIVVEKGTEIGISAFLPILTERSIPDPSNRSTRWQQKAIAAMKQSGRCRCPDILQPMKFNDAVDFYADSTQYIAHADDSVDYKKDLLDAKTNKGCIVLFVGPEGGFTENEVQYALAHHVELISLGIRRLRSETAGLVGAIKILSTAGEL